MDVVELADRNVWYLVLMLCDRMLPDLSWREKAKLVSGLWQVVDPLGGYAVGMQAASDHIAGWMRGFILQAASEVLVGWMI